MNKHKIPQRLIFFMTLKINICNCCLYFPFISLNNEHRLHVLLFFIPDEMLLIRNLKFYNGNVEKAFKRLISNMELRQYYTNVYEFRDPFDARLRRLIDQM